MRVGRVVVRLVDRHRDSSKAPGQRLPSPSARRRRRPAARSWDGFPPVGVNAPLERRQTGWHRLLAAFRLVHGGVQHA
jgi:hypothetical protein